jgi:pimeloyl-ACP methyl ester carboxylesterase
VGLLGRSGLATVIDVIELATRTFTADGLTLAYHDVGSGRPVLLLHGYISPALDTWMRSGAASGLLAAGRRLIMPDMRAHGESAKPHEPAAYPPDALVADVQALIAHLGLTGYDLAGYSLGARVAARLMALGARPGRAVLGGTGLDPNADPVALSCLFDTFVDTPAKRWRESTSPPSSSPAWTTPPAARSRISPPRCPTPVCFACPAITSPRSSGMPSPTNSPPSWRRTAARRKGGLACPGRFDRRTDEPKR